MDGGGDASAVRCSKTSPSFLHANSTSHTWVFSAFAELIDNAYDPDVAATELSVDKKTFKGIPVLVFLDNGKGMIQEKLYKMLSLGYCEKVEVRGHKPVGQYGNGFKSGSMRLGRDAMVFTKSSGTMSVGFLSQTYLEEIKSDTVLVPIVTWDATTKHIIESADSAASLKALTMYSLFNSEKDLLGQFLTFSKGTLILIYNLKRGSAGRLELDFDSKSRDIIYSAHQELDFATDQRPVQEYMPEYRRSLRDYCSILFLRPRMKIILRGEKVKTKLVSKSLSKTEYDVYKPMWLGKSVRITFGFCMPQDDYGILMYHRNRLIKAYEKVGYQRNQSLAQANGVVGIVQCDFLEPIHNKQDFNKTDRYNSFVNAIGMKLNDYWNEKTQCASGSTTESGQNDRLPDWTWAQCSNDNCLKWRRLPGVTDSTSLPDKWFCYMNSDPTHNRCDIAEEPEDEDELLNQATYKKTYKKQQEHERRKKAEDQRVTKERLELSLQDKARYQKQLAQAEQRERQQKQIIEQLNKQKADIALQQQKLRQTMAADDQWLQQIPAAQRNSTPVTNRKRREHDFANVSASKRRREKTVTINGNRTTTSLTTAVAANGTHIEHVKIDDDDDDDDVIIISSQDYDHPTTTPSSVSVKVESVKSEGTDLAVTIIDPLPVGNTEGASSDTTVTTGMNIVRTEKDELIGELKQQLKESEDRCISLQRNVESLLKIIVPDLQVPSLSFVNDIVIEMVKANCRQAAEDGNTKTPDV